MSIAVPCVCQEIIDVIYKKQTFLILPHIHVDGDCIGCSLAVYSALKQLGKEAYIYCPETLSDFYNILTTKDCIKTAVPETTFDAVILIECPTLDRTPKDPKGENIDWRKFSHTFINIDHHEGNTIAQECQTQLNWVDTKSSALGELIYLLVANMKVTLTKEIADALYFALVTDSGSFRHSTVSSRTHLIASKLVEVVGNVEPINLSVYRKSPQHLILFGLALSKMQLSEDKTIAWTDVTSEMLEKSQCSQNEVSSLTNELNLVNCEAFVLFKAVKEEEIRVSMRSTGPEVNKAAALFGGGGHKQAAACSVPHNDLEKAHREVLKAVEEVVKEYHK